MIVLVVATLVILLGLVAFAVDLGIMYTARAEAQRAADSGAHAGAGVFLLAPSNWTTATAQARDFAEDNPVRWAPLDVLDEDIDVIPDSQKVRVRVYRTEERGNSIPTLFARMVGIETIDVGAVAAAQSWPSDGAECMLPFAIPDRWDVFEDGAYRSSRSGDVYDPDRGDRYLSPATPRDDGYYTGYGLNSIGEEFLLKPQNPSGTPQPDWYYPIRLEGTQGADDYREAVADCWQPGDEVVLGDYVDSEPGNMAGPTRKGFKDIMDDPEEANIYWDEACGCPRNQEGNMVGTSSRRVRPLIMFHPEDWEDIHLGAQPVPVRNFAGVFIDRVDPNGDIWIRWMQYTTVRSADTWDPDNGSLLRSLRIVE